MISAPQPSRSDSARSAPNPEPIPQPTSDRRWFSPPLDGFRGLCIIAVLAQHTFNGRYTNAGWIGVDMFFVLSGYLITTLLIREVDLSGTIDLGRFYLRRALRLLPALAGMLLVVTVLRLLVASHPAYPGILRDAAVAGL